MLPDRFGAMPVHFRWVPLHVRRCYSRSIAVAATVATTTSCFVAAFAATIARRYAQSPLVWPVLELMLLLSDAIRSLPCVLQFIPRATASSDSSVVVVV